MKDEKERSGEVQLELALERVQKDQGEWMEEAAAAIRTCARFLRDFTTDAVWHTLEGHGVAPPRDPRAMGAAIRRAKKDGLIEATGEYRKSSRPECHRRPIPVYRASALDGQGEKE